MRSKPDTQPKREAPLKPAAPAKRRFSLASEEFCQFFGGSFQPGDLVESYTRTVISGEPKVTRVYLGWRKASDIPTGRA